MRSRRQFLGMAGGLVLVGGLLVTSAGLSAQAAPFTVHIRPAAMSRLASTTQPLTEAQCVADFTAPCYDPSQIQSAYDEGPLFSKGITGAGETIVIVDSFGSPTIQSDLATFDSTFGLPAPPSFKIIQPAGPVAPWNPHSSNMVGWAGETTLDVEWSHTIAPGANILLVETPVSENEGTSGFPQIVQAENYVVNHHLGDVISQSFSATEQTFPTAQSLLQLRSAYINADKNGVTVLAASGDSGVTDYADNDGEILYTHRVTSWPDSDPLVTGVGGTRLSLDSAGNRTAPDRVWNDTYNTTLSEDLFGSSAIYPDAGGGGKSIIFSRPSYQDGVANVVGLQRGVPDIAMSAACSGLVNTYQSFPGQAAGWYVACGTSEATPMFAGIVALADQAAHHSLGLINPALYSMSAAQAPGIVDITQGNNTVAFTQDGTNYSVNGFKAGPGYDLASGVGTVDAAYFVPELAAAAGSGGDAEGS